MPCSEPAFWHPSGMQTQPVAEPGVSLRFDPGYLLSSLRDEPGKRESRRRPLP